MAFFYASHPPVELLGHYARVVVDADQVSDAEVAALRARGARVLAYLSVGEIDPDRAWSRAAEPSWRIGRNEGWGSAVVDVRKPGWGRLVQGQGEAVRARGFDGLFLDTLDSYQRAITDEEGRRDCEAALAELVRGLRQRLPKATLVLNRGFEILPEVAGMVDGVAAESLFREWDAEARRYVEVSAADRRWLQQALERVVHRHHLPVTVIDYLPPSQRREARALAARIAALGYTPWVASALLDSMGVGAVEVLPRTVLMLYDGAEAPTLAESAPHRLGAMPLEHMGYAVEYLDVRSGALPSGSLAGRYAGVVTWFTDDALPQPARLRRFLSSLLEDGVRLAILGDLGFPVDAELLGRLGLARGPLHVREPLAVTLADAMVGFEARPSLRKEEVSSYRAASPEVTVHAAVREGSGQVLSLVGTAPWGAFALDPYVVASGIEGRLRWVLDPFAFYRAALGTPPLAPDVTTENGRRLLTAHIDGDGFLNQAEVLGRPYAAELVRDRVLKRFPLPVTVSVIEGEVGPAGLHPEVSPRLEAIARAIFALPNVELASHTFSHPFDWYKAASETGGSDVYHLPIPGYRYDPAREVTGSVDYINSRLAPPGKKVQVFLWSGEAEPGAVPLRMAREAGLMAVNGGNTQMTRERDSLTEVSPIGVPVGGEFQVYAPVQNENIYTNLWRGPFYGYRGVLETFALTDAPRRLKPIAIYHHFYSGEKPASLGALEEVYRWALAQESLPLRLSDYARKASAFRGVTVARRLDGSFDVQGVSTLRTLRVDAALGPPDPRRSRGVAGYRDLPQGRYLALDGRDRVHLVFSAAAQKAPILRQANAAIVEWSPSGAGLAFRLRGHLPVRVELGAAAGCRLRGGKATQARDGDALTLSFDGNDTGRVTLACH